MKVTVVIEYEFQDLELLTQLDVEAIEAGVADSVASSFNPANADPISADCWSVRVDQ